MIEQCYTLQELRDCTRLFYQYNSYVEIDGQRWKLTAICGIDDSTRKFYEEAPEGHIRVHLAHPTAAKKMMLAGSTPFACFEVKK